MSANCITHWAHTKKWQVEMFQRKRKIGKINPFLDVDNPNPYPNAQPKPNRITDDMREFSGDVSIIGNHDSTDIITEEMNDSTDIITEEMKEVVPAVTLLLALKQV